MNPDLSAPGSAPGGQPDFVSPSSDAVPPGLLASLYRIRVLAGAEKESREILAEILDEIVRFFPAATSGSIALLAPDTVNLEIEVSVGLPADAAKCPLKPGEGITGWVALHGKPLLVPNTTSDPRYREARTGVRSEIAAPLIDSGQVVGVVNLDSDTPDAFSETDLAHLARLASDTSLSLASLWRTRQLANKAAHLESILSVGQSLVARLDLPEILDSIASETRTLISAPVCAILLLDSTGTKLERLSVPENGARHPDLALGETSAGAAVAHRKQIEIFHLLKTEENVALLRMARDHGLASALFTPIVFEGDVAGVIAVYADRPHRFSDEEKSLVRAMANLGAVAVNNARLYERLLHTQETLRRSEKLTALGLLAAEVAHEIRNPLTVIKLLYQSLGLDFPPGDPRNEDRRVIEEKLDHLESTVSRILSFARTPNELRSRLALREVVADTLALIRLKAAQSGIQIDFRPAAEDLHVKGNKGQLQQVLLNLLLNSLQAMDRAGKLTVLTRAENRDDVPGAAVEVIDTGPGIPEGIRDRIFETFLTERAEGSGLGLGIARQIVAAHNGSIDVLHTGPAGTRIQVWLPQPPS